MAIVVKNPSASAGNMRDASSVPGLGRFPGGRIPWTEEPGRPQSIGLHRVRRDRSDLAYMQNKRNVHENRKILV